MIGGFFHVYFEGRLESQKSRIHKIQSQSEGKKNNNIKVRRARRGEERAAASKRAATGPYHCQSISAITLHYGRSREPRTEQQMFCEELFCSFLSSAVVHCFLLCPQFLSKLLHYSFMIRFLMFSVLFSVQHVQNSSHYFEPSEVNLSVCEPFDPPALNSSGVIVQTSHHESVASFVCASIMNR